MRRELAAALTLAHFIIAAPLASAQSSPAAALAERAYQRAVGALAPDARSLNTSFERAAAEFDVPVELLQGIAYAESRWQHHLPDAGEPHGAPPPFGVMGLRDDVHFRRTLREAARLIGQQPDALKRSAALNIRGMAALLRHYAPGKTRATPLEQWEDAIAQASGIPQRDIAQMHTYEILAAISEGRSGSAFAVKPREVDLESPYGRERLRELRAPMVTTPARSAADPANIRSTVGAAAAGAPDYPPAEWSPTTCNYSSRSGTAISHVAIHTTQGSYAGSISWFKNCTSSASAHYIIRSSDGQVTQVVRESDKAWHVKADNPYTVGIEHEAFSAPTDKPGQNPWFTDPMYKSSAALARDVIDSNKLASKVYDGSKGWNAVLAKADFSVKGHVNFSGQTHTDPGPAWDWAKYKSLVDDAGGVSPPPSLAKTDAIVLTGDFNGDGRADIAIVRRPGSATDPFYGRIAVELSTGSGFRSETWSAQAPTAMYTGNGTADDYAVLAGDFNGDGRTDIAFVRRSATGVDGWATSIALELSTGAGFTSVSWRAQAPVKMTAGGGTTRDYRVLAGDFNGDGKTDLAILRRSAGGADGWQSNIAIEQSTGAGFTSRWIASGTAARMWAGGGTTASYFTVVGDFNGDGRADLATLSAAAAGTWRDGIAIELGGATGFTSQFWASATPAQMRAGTGYMGDYRVLAGDFNGDRRTDLVTLRRSRNGTDAWATRVSVDSSSGAGFVSSLWPAGTASEMAAHAGTIADYATVVGDFNADGRADLATVSARAGGQWADGVLIELSDGARFTSQRWLTATPGQMRGGGADRDYRTFAGAFNAATGAQDLVTMSPNGTGTNWSSAFAVDLVWQGAFVNRWWPAASAARLRE